MKDRRTASSKEEKKKPSRGEKKGKYCNNKLEDLLVIIP